LTELFFCFGEEKHMVTTASWYNPDGRRLFIWMLLHSWRWLQHPVINVYQHGFVGQKLASDSFSFVLKETVLER